MKRRPYRSAVAVIFFALLPLVAIPAAFYMWEWFFRYMLKRIG